MGRHPKVLFQIAAQFITNEWLMAVKSAPLRKIERARATAA
jgi:hypothetical protein